MEHAFRRPLGLEDRFGRAASDMLRVGEPAMLSHIGYPQLASIPRHVGVVPRQVREARAIRVEPRRGIEVVARRQNLAVIVAIQADAYQRVDRLSRAGMVLPDAD